QRAAPLSHDLARSSEGARARARARRPGLGGQAAAGGGGRFRARREGAAPGRARGPGARPTARREAARQVRPGGIAPVSRRAPGSQGRGGDGTRGRSGEAVSTDSTSRLTRLAPALALLACAAALYARSLPAPFLFDDQPSIVENENARSLWPLWHALGAPPQSSVAGRPL